MELTGSPHRRYNPLNGDWVLVSPHRTARPWQGRTEALPGNERPHYDAGCYLCPGNRRAGNEVNPKYTGTYVFTNDFSALLSEESTFFQDDEIIKARSEQGICRVVCFSPDHSKSLPDMEVGDIKSVIDVWQYEYRRLGHLEYIRHVQIFENKGELMGCSNPHPHGQIWAQENLPNEAVKRTYFQAEYYEKHQRSLLSDYLEKELEDGQRIICQNEAFVILVPFWAVWPFETMIIPRAHEPSILLMKDEEKLLFAEAVKCITAAYDKLFDTSFPYSAGIHQCPTDGEFHPGWHWHMSFYPPLLRSATVKKFMVGFEMFAMPQRDITPEQAAERLRECL